MAVDVRDGEVSVADAAAQWRAERADRQERRLLAVPADEGGVRAAANHDLLQSLHGALRAKQAVADLAEDTLRRLSRVLGGGTFSQRSLLSHWFEDVRALGFLRPPWGLAYDNLVATSFATPDASRP